MQAGTIIQFATPLGDFNVELFNTETPQTVENFLTYVNDGDFINSLVHRSAKLGNGDPFVLQGGGFDSTFTRIPTNPPVQNEPGISNTRGTIAMARLGGQVNSATNQWFINLNDANTFLDTVDEGFTVFGEVVGNGMEIVDALAALPTFDYRGTLGGAF